MDQYNKIGENETVILFKLQKNLITRFELVLVE